MTKKDVLNDLNEMLERVRYLRKATDSVKQRDKYFSEIMAYSYAISKIEQLDELDITKDTEVSCLADNKQVCTLKIYQTSADNSETTEVLTIDPANLPDCDFENYSSKQ